MIKQVCSLLICMLLVTAVNAQRMNVRKLLKKRTAETSVYGGLGFYGNAHWVVGTSIHYLHGVGLKKQWLSVGTGLRINVFNSEKREYTTSSRRLTALNFGGADSMYMPKVQTNTINAYIAMKIHIKRGVDVFFTTDIGGVNFADSKDGYFHSYETARTPSPGIKYKTEPYAFNVSIPWSESYGTLASEMYGSFRLNHILWWRLGFQYLRNEYKVDRNIPMNGKRFYQNHWMVTTGLTIDIRWPQNAEQSQYF
jgi:hypothetical protein